MYHQLVRSHCLHGWHTCDVFVQLLAGRQGGDETAERYYNYAEASCQLVPALTAAHILTGNRRGRLQ